MEVNTEALNELLEERFEGNQTLMAKAFQVNRHQLNKVLKTGKGAGADFCGAIIKWCECNGIFYKKFIFLH